MLFHSCKVRKHYLRIWLNKEQGDKQGKKKKRKRMLENKLHLLDVSYVSTFFCHIYHRSLRFISYKASMAKEKSIKEQGNLASRSLK